MPCTDQRGALPVPRVRKRDRIRYAERRTPGDGSPGARRGVAMGATESKKKGSAEAAASVNARLADRRREWMQRDKEAGEARVLAWWRSEFGQLPHEDLVDESGAATDPRLAPVGYRDFVCALRALDVHRANHLELLRNTFYSSLRMPTLEQLELANQVLNAVNAALQGDDPRVWRAVRSGLSAMTLDRRFAVIERMQVLLEFRVDWLSDKRMAPLEHFRRMSPTSDVRRTFEAMQADIPGLTDAEVFAALDGVNSVSPTKGRGKKSVFVAVARIGVDRKLWGMSISRAQDGGDRERAVQRCARTLSQAWTTRPALSKKSTPTR